MTDTHGPTPGPIPGPTPRRAPRPRIGITVHAAEQEAKEGHLEVRFQLTARYAAAVTGAGGLPLMLPSHPEAAAAPEDVLDAIDGLLLSGGGSLPSTYFADHPEPSLRQTNPPRYDVEVALVRAALERGMPMIGICRGMQTMVEAVGGELVRDLRTLPGAHEHYQTQQPPYPTHDLRVATDSRLAGWIGTSCQVNSFHRQVVRSVPEGWRVTAWSDDDLPEAVEHVDAFAVGLQFHPEWLAGVHPGFATLFRDFVSAAEAYRLARRAGLPG